MDLVEPWSVLINLRSRAAPIVTPASVSSSAHLSTSAVEPDETADSSAVTCPAGVNSCGAKCAKREMRERGGRGGGGAAGGGREGEGDAYNTSLPLTPQGFDVRRRGGCSDLLRQQVRGHLLRDLR